MSYKFKMPNRLFIAVSVSLGSLFDIIHILYIPVVVGLAGNTKY